MISRNSNPGILRLLFIPMFLLFVASCSKTESDKVLSSENELIKIEFPEVNGESPLIYKNANEYHITLPMGTSLNAVLTDFKVSPGAKVKVNGQEIKDNKGKLNLDEVLKVEVVAENGSVRRYSVLVKEGYSNIDNLIYEFQKKYSIPGASLAISSSDNHEVLYKSGYGFAEVETSTRVRPNHLFRLASVSKQFTALCIMKLVDEGKITLDSKVFGPGSILGEDFPEAPSLAHQVTVKHLLSHTSGWTSNPDPMFTAPYASNTLTQNIRYMLTTPQNTPGTSFSYYNMGFGVLGSIIEKVTGKKFEIYLKEVLSLAGINDIHVGGNRAARRPNEVVYYSQNNTNGYNNNMEMIAAAGGIIASTEQMLKLLPYIDGKSDVPDILSKPVRDAMFTKVISTSSTLNNFYALGWRGGHRLYPESFYHSGNLAGTATMWVIGPEVNVVLLLNSRSYISDFDNQMYYLMEKLVNLGKVLNSRK